MKKWCVLLGGFLIHFCLGIPYIFGNLVTYISSYMHHRGFYKKDNIGDEQWIISPFMAALIIAMTITRSIIKRLGVRLALFMATAVFTGGQFLTYLAVQHSIWSTVITYGAICGLGAGVSYVTTVDLASQWFPSNVATATSMVTAGFSFGGLVFNYVVSFYVNPENLSPDIQLGSLR
ncbi:hypothetical protein SNE40_000372 [Patella caerulea]|uniref:Major facilitator superfamily (MFS) profile domain-containing protein n=1 Tax=Patella caerulea TaxID=87958 RepID=A0AAN8KAF0_PATCE